MKYSVIGWLESKEYYSLAMVSRYTAAVEGLHTASIIFVQSLHLSRLASPNKVLAECTRHYM